MVSSMSYEPGEVMRPEGTVKAGGDPKCDGEGCSEKSKFLGKDTCGNGLQKLFGARLRNWRTVKELPLKHVATDLHVSVQIVSDWERGKRFPCCRHLEMISSYTELPLCAFLRDEIECTVQCPHAAILDRGEDSN